MIGFASPVWILTAALLIGLLMASGTDAGAARSAARYTREPALEAPVAARLKFGGFIGERLKANRDNWLLTAPFANPAMLDMFRDRDREPHRDLLPWSGEFVGKYLTAAVLNWRITRAASLKRVIEQVVSDFIATQSAEGYLGPFPKEQRLMVGWDLWGHYHAFVGLLLYYDDTGDERALQAVRKAADFICDTFPEGGQRVLSAGSEEMNEAIIHGMLLLYERTGEQRYMDMARRVEQDWETPPSGDYVRTALAGTPFHQTPKPRWESLHDLQAIAEFYFITGDAKYRNAFEHIWWSIVETDRHNTGGFSSGEQACGNPYNPAAIETCCTVAWLALSLDMLRLTGLSVVADEIELATFNGGIGGQSPSGRWWTYNTPMEGEKKASAHDINFQCRPGSPELNCCSVNGPRILGMLGQWSLMAARDGLALNYYGPCEVSAKLPSGERVTVRQKTTYPRDGKVEINVGLSQPRRFALRLRIPYWSARTTVKVNGEQVPAQAGTYLTLSRTWKDGDKVVLALDMSPHFWVGEREFEGKTSVYRGPVLLAYDPRFNETPFDQLAPLRASDMQPKTVPRTQWPKPWLLLRFTGADGTPMLLCDFASAGATGSQYHTWLRVEGIASTAFSRANPLRSARPQNHHC
ncbi:MAG: glycoside hydrolase family 127 protein [Armatimonadota bacterium]|nr:MAG: glycoside hydrolase family 127 protein [Armatimonadota bacterium]